MVQHHFLEEAQLMLTNPCDVFRSQLRHQTWYHSICSVWFPISVL